MASYYSLEEVSKHCQRSDLWVASRGKVYNVTTFTGRHPGGMEVLMEHGGEDVTTIMNNLKPHRHSSAAYKMLDQYYIGELGTEATVEAVAKDAIDDKAIWNNNHAGNGDISQKGNAATTTKEYKFQPDVSKAMFWQIGKLGRNYREWIHSPIDQDLRFFEWDFFESLTQCQWYVVPTVWVPIAILFIYLSYSNFTEIGPEILMPWLFGGVNVKVWYMPALFILGVFIWTFFEYVIHRWVFHLNPPHWSKVLITLHFLFHGQHHKNPMNKDRLVFPPVPASFFAFVIYHLYMSLLPRATAQCIIAGTVVGYIFYDLMHYYLHHGTPKTSYLKDLKKYHINHHYVEQQKGFGISSKFWDYPFATLSPMVDYVSKSR